VAFKDGTDIDSNPPTSSAPTQGRLAQRGLGDANASGYAGTEAEKSIINALLAGETGRAADTYGALGSLLYGPVVRGGDAS
jgi:phospholipid/cholesterol/gamma-HCH transport system substrate-binding protein